MAFQNLPDLGYKDNGPLGAFFAGINGGNANVASQLANAQAAENLQQSQYDNPLKSLGNLYDASLASAKMNDPNYIPAQLLGQIGQMKSQQYAGKKAEALSDFDIENEKQKLKNGLLSGQLDQKTYDEQMRMINELLAGGGQQPSAPIGFSMTPSPEYRKENYGNEGHGLSPLPILKTEAAMKSSMGNDYRTGDMPYDLETLDKEIKLHGDKTGELGKERARLVASLQQGGGGGEIPVPQQTTYSNLIPTQSVLAKMAGTRTLDPKFVGDMAKLETKVDSAEDIARMRAISASRNAQKTMSEPKYNEQLAKHRDTVAIVETKLAMQKPVTEQEYVEYRKAFNWIQDHNVTRQIANGANFKGTTPLAQFGIEQGPSPISQVQTAQPMPFNGAGQQAVPINNDIKTKVESAGQVYDPSKYEYRISPSGEVQRKPKG